MAKTYPNGVVSPEPGDQIPASGAGAWDLVAASTDAQLGNRYTKAQADALLAGKAPTTHTHDSRYYTETEMDTKLAGKSGTAHTHPTSAVTGLDAALAGKASKEPVNLGSEDLNTLVEDNVYSQSSSSIASAALNYPQNSNGLYTAGTLRVASRAGDYLVTQEFVSYNGRDYFWRARYAGTWYPWERSFRAAEADPLVARVSTLEYDSGWRDVTPLLGEQYISGEYWVKRVRNTVYLHFYELKLVAGTGSSVRPSWALITGFRPSTRYANMPFAGKNATQYAAGPVRVSRYGVTDIYGYADGLMIDADVSFDTEDAPLAPAALPGTAVTIF